MTVGYWCYRRVKGSRRLIVVVRMEIGRVLLVRAIANLRVSLTLLERGLVLKSISIELG